MGNTKKIIISESQLKMLQSNGIKLTESIPLKSNINEDVSDDKLIEVITLFGNMLSRYKDRMDATKPKDGETDWAIYAFNNGLVKAYEHTIQILTNL